MLDSMDLDCFVLGFFVVLGIYFVLIIEVKEKRNVIVKINKKVVLGKCCLFV